MENFFLIEEKILKAQIKDEIIIDGMVQVFNIKINNENKTYKFYFCIF